MLRARSISAFSRIGRPPHDWVLIQSGFAIERIDEERARTQMELLNRYTGGPPMDDDGLASADAEFDWDRMSMTRSNSGAEEG